MKFWQTSIFHFTYIFFALISFNCEASNFPFIDARTYSMGNTFSVLPGFANPSGFGYESDISLSLQYENRYGIKELSTYAGYINYPNKYLSTALYVSRFGFKDFNETYISANIYKRLASIIILGVRVNYVQLNYSDYYSSKSAVTADIGMTIEPLQDFKIAILAVNPIRTAIQIGDEKIELPAKLLLGLSYIPEKNFLITAEIEKDISLPLICKLGLEYNPIKQLSIRTGISGKPFTPSFGIGLHFDPFSINVGFSKHAVLGFRSACGLQFRF